jgi:hypothetical protein
MSHNPMGLHGLLQGQLYFFFAAEGQREIDRYGEGNVRFFSNFLSERLENVRKFECEILRLDLYATTNSYKGIRCYSTRSGRLNTTNCVI